MIIRVFNVFFLNGEKFRNHLNLYKSNLYLVYKNKLFDFVKQY